MLPEALHYSTDDTIAFVLPLFKLVLGIHESGLVAPFEREDALFTTDGVLDLDKSLAHPPMLALYRVQALFPHKKTGPLEAAAPQTPHGLASYMSGHRCFEIALGHHDPQTDIFCLGLLLASRALSVDLENPQDLALFIQARTNPSQVNPRIHPTVSRLITEMTELDRSRRSQDLYDIINRLEHYRDYDPEKQADLSLIPGWVDKNPTERDGVILNKLRNRLFDVSRRNRLLYYKPNLRLVNLTLSSVPLVLHYESIRPELLFTWNAELSEKIINGKEILLNKYLRFEDYPSLPAALDRVRVDARRDEQEYGFSALKLVVAFLNWHNLKEEAPEERIQTPLLLLPVSLKKNKKVKEDHYILKVLDNTAEVNPVLAGLLRELYGIRLPDFIDLDEMSPEQFHQLLKTQIEEVNQGIRLEYIDKPRIEIIQGEGPKTFTSNDPHVWDFDVCHMVLGNFHYKKMSLVRDYNTVIDRGQPHPSFDALFSEHPRDWPEYLFDGNSLTDWFHVVPADPTQTSAILQSRGGHSYIIQGPPGTGKSQTITNLIADFVARGKNILFVCEKRAALDVVFHRLKQVGLEELCCYIHDSQGDKREFIKNLKATYEDFAVNRMDLAALKQQRDALLHSMNRELELLRGFHDTSSTEETSSGMTIRDLIEKLIALRQHLVPLTVVEEELLPAFNEWQTAEPIVIELERLLDETEPRSTFSTHPFRHIKEAIFLSSSPYQTLDTALRDSLKALDECEALLVACRLDPQLQQDTERVKSLVQFAVLLYPLARTGNITLADPDSVAANEWQQQLRQYRQMQESYRQTQQKNSHWQHKIDERDLGAAIALATKYEHAFMGRFNGSWRKFKNRLEPQYDFSAHSVRPSYQTVLQGLQGEYAAAAQLEQTRRALEDRYRFGQNLDTTILSIDMLQSRKGHPDLDYLLQHPDGPALVTALQNLHQPLNRLETALNRCLQTPPTSGIRDTLLNIQLNIDALPDWLPALSNSTAQPETVKAALRQLPLRYQQTQAAIIRKLLQQFYQSHREYAATEGATLDRAVRHMETSYPALQEINAKVIRAFVRQKFLNQTKNNFKEGRKILENEFGKIMRYKSIRELSEKESGQVLKLLKPIWLMSPYSVSDSLPLDDEHFDVVIYDEASQITLEEGVPALYRSKQTIIVGDEKQMPPTDFFSSGSKDKDPDDIGQNEAQNEEWLSDDADSLLAQGARKLTSTLLSWHYRSHYEALISFSNHAFYEGELLTIPDRTTHRCITFHHLPESVYERRSNPAEAAFIARLVRDLLHRQTSESIGIVAFSQEQQRAIETALDTLAEEDAVFAQQLEEAYNRTANDQFVGLIIKNLENIQGDELDIIIISVCYGPDSRGRMLMNFGPVNKKGGEKRLNVLFSRARKHMTVVSSIRYDQITNEYNEGAGYLRRFLQYAELVSSGKMNEAHTILDGLTPEKPAGADAITPTVIRNQIKDQLTAMGYEVAGPVGQSDFKCSLAVKRNASDEEYALAILIDDEDHYRNENLVEQYYQRPAILHDFGWKVLPVYAKDWLHQPNRVMEQIIRALAPNTAGGQTHSSQEGQTSNSTNAQRTPEPAAPVGQYDHLEFHRLVNPADGLFWEGATEHNKLIVRWGRQGARVQIRLRTFADETTAQKELAKLEEEQKQKGFVPDQQENDQEPR